MMHYSVTFVTVLIISNNKITKHNSIMAEKVYVTQLRRTIVSSS